MLSIMKTKKQKKFLAKIRGQKSECFEKKKIIMKTNYCNNSNYHWKLREKHWIEFLNYSDFQKSPPRGFKKLFKPWKIQEKVQPALKIQEPLQALRIQEVLQSLLDSKRSSSLWRFEDLKNMFEVSSIWDQAFTLLVNVTQVQPMSKPKLKIHQGLSLGQGPSQVPT